ncbi:hypothetical protein PM082_002935 [Marasmius tenuissimus]|nr:hypothetical protein PM082_002935 [Marasmius tenuissimus]
MQTDSETESDSGVESLVVPTKRSAGVSQLSYTTSSKQTDRSVPVAIQLIHQADLDDSTNNADVRTDVLEAANSIIEFLHLSIEHEETTKTILPSVSALMEPKFLSILFDHRKVFRRLATRELLTAVDSSSMVVCWVDTLLVKLAEVITLLIGDSKMEPKPVVSDFLERQRQHDNLAAATQLPVSWLKVASVLDSTHSSPAAKRLSLRLLFGVYVIVPWCLGNDPWNDPQNLPSQELLRIMDRHVSHPFSKHGPGLGSTERLSLSMTLSLYAAADTEARLSEDFSPLRPRTMGNLLDYLYCILNPEHMGGTTWLTSPIEALDASQKVLIRWRETVLWCWKKWDDSRIANSDIVTCLTAQWLYHSDSDDGESASHIGAIKKTKLLESDPTVVGGALSVGGKRRKG